MDVADFNNDGKADLIATGPGTNTVSIRYGDGAGNFSAATSIPMGLSSEATVGKVLVADLNNDGNQDFVANYANQILIRLGNGSGGFTAAPTVMGGGAGPSGLSIALGDLNNDGNQDIVSGSVEGLGTQFIYASFGDGTGGFTAAAQQVQLPHNTLSLVLGDFNSDGRLDLTTTGLGAAPPGIRLGQCSSAPGISVSGRLLSSEGRGIRNARVILTDDQGVSVQAITGPRGSYQFDNVESDRTYVISVASRRFQFEPKVVSITDEITGMDFVAIGPSTMRKRPIQVPPSGSLRTANVSPK